MKKITLIIIFLLIPNFSYAFWPKYHVTTTKESLSMNDFDEESQEVVSLANTRTDLLEQHKSEAHADGNNLGGAKDRLVEQKILIIENLESCDRISALKELGRALHTVQDIYSHSNAVDNDRGVDLFNLSNGQTRKPDGSAVCNNYNGFAPGYLVTGHFSLIGAAYGALNPFGPPPNSLDEGSCIGALLQITDEGIHIYSGGAGFGECCHQWLNKDSPGSENSANHTPALGRAFHGTNTFLQSLFRDIEDKYPKDEAIFYKNMLKKKQKRLVYVVDTTGSMEDDWEELKGRLNTDINGFLKNKESPNLGLITFKDADEIEYKSFECAKLEDFRSSINEIEVVGGDDCKEASAEALQKAFLSHFDPFTDPRRRKGTIFLATDASASNERLMQSMRNFAANHGINIDTLVTGSCAEEINSVLVSNNFIPSYNTKQIKSSELYEEKIKKNEDPILSESSWVMFQALSEQTGGVSFQVNKNEIASVLSNYDFISNTDSKIIFSKIVKADVKQVINTPILVDDTVTGKIKFLIKTTDRSIFPKVLLTNPNGEVIDQNNRNTKITNLSSMVFYTIDAPLAGEWNVSIFNGNSEYLVKVYAVSDFDVLSLKFLETPKTPNLKEVSLVPIIGNPIIGNPIIGQNISILLNLTSSLKSIKIELINKNEEVIQILDNITDEGNNTYKTPIFSIPNEDFQLKLSGVFNNDSKISRVISKIISPQTFSLSLENVIVIAPYDLVFAINTLKFVPSTTVNFNLVIENSDNEAKTFLIKTESINGFVFNAPNEVTVSSGSNTVVSVSISIPNNAQIGSVEEIMFIATDKDNSMVSNYISESILIETDVIFTNGFE